MIWSILAKIAL